MYKRFFNDEEMPFALHNYLLKQREQRGLREQSYEIHQEGELQEHQEQGGRTIAHLIKV